VLDCLKPLTHKKLIEHELEGFGIRLNKQPPKINFKKKDKVGRAARQQALPARVRVQHAGQQGACCAHLLATSSHCALVPPAGRAASASHPPSRMAGWTWRR
jgi:hypothetical protein